MNRLLSGGPLGDATMDALLAPLYARLAELDPNGRPQRLTLTRQRGGPCSFTGCTMLGHGYPIYLEYDPCWPGQHHRRVKRYARAAGVSDPTTVIVQTILEHEIAHETICPRTQRAADAMKLAIAPVLKAGDKWTPRNTQFVANMVADQLINVANVTLPNTPGHCHYADGLVLSWYDQAAAPFYWSRRPWWRALWSHLFHRRTFEPYFEIFIRAQLLFFPRARFAHGQLLAKFFTAQRKPTPRQIHEACEPRPWPSQPAVELALDEVADINADWIHDPEILYDENAWPGLARDLCRLWLPFLPKDPPAAWRPHRLFEYRDPESAWREDQCPPAPVSSSGRSVAGEQKPNDAGPAREGEQDAAAAPPDSANAGGSPEPAAGGTGQSNVASSGPGDAIPGAAQAARDVISPPNGAAADDGPSPRAGARQSTNGQVRLTSVPWYNRDCEEITLETNKVKALDAYYSWIAGETELNLKTDPPEREAQLDPKLVSVFELEDTEIGRMERIQSILFCLDRSGSMTGGSGAYGIAPWSEGSFYHSALISVYAVVNWLARAHSDYRINLLTFSTTTKITGWCTYHDFRPWLPDEALVPESGGTWLDPKTLEACLPENQGVLVLIVSDGILDPANAADLVKLFTRDDIRRRCFPVHLNTNSSPSNSLADAMTNAGLKVVPIPSPGGIPRVIESHGKFLD